MQRRLPPSAGSSAEAHGGGRRAAACAAIRRRSPLPQPRSGRMIPALSARPSHPPTSSARAIWPRSCDSSEERFKHRLSTVLTPQLVAQPRKRGVQALYRSSDGMRARGALATNLHHDASSHSVEGTAPSNRGIRQSGPDLNRRTRLDILILVFADMASGTINAVAGGNRSVTMLASPGLIEASEDHHRLDAMKTILSVGTAAATLAVLSTGGAVGCPQGTVMLFAAAGGRRGGATAALSGRSRHRHRHRTGPDGLFRRRMGGRSQEPGWTIRRRSHDCRLGAGPAGA